MRTVGAKLMLLVLAATCFQPPIAAQTSGDSAVEAGKEALGGYNDYPWYDESQDTLRRIDVQPLKDLTTRKSKWQSRESQWEWPEWLKTVLEVLGWCLVVLGVMLVIYALLRAFGMDSWRNNRVATAGDDSLQGDIDRIEALPFQLQRPQTDLLAEARRLYEAGNYTQAIVYLYSYQLVQLDRHQMIRLTKGKTNRQYLREMRARRELAELLSRSMITFEDAFFGHHAIDRDRFERCWKGLPEFHQQLEQAAA